MANENNPDALDFAQAGGRPWPACHYGYRCYNPPHMGVLVGRLHSRLKYLGQALAEEPCHWWPALDRQLHQRMVVIVDEMGLIKPRKLVPIIAFPSISQALVELRVPSIRTENGSAMTKIPFNWREDYRRLKLAQLGVCPWGLACQAPQEAENAITELYQIMTQQVEARLSDAWAGWDWRWDMDIYTHLINMLELLGLDSVACLLRAETDASRQVARRRQMPPDMMECRNAHNTQQLLANLANLEDDRPCANGISESPSTT